MNGKDYLENQVLTAQPHQLHLMVVDGALRFARKAAQAIENNQFEVGHFALDKSRDLVAELIGGLDPAHQPEMIEQLKALFIFVYENLNHADVKQEASYIHDAIKVLEIHREAWCELIQTLQPDTIDENKTVHSHDPLKRPHHIEHSEKSHQSRSWLT
ncbi:MAG: flagellar export chaperone FliS [Planctomycetes bacterium]|nr:flagellar export chaperone FliS [Planctomycetota bacterium]MCH9725819.1 flagellar export chaperone FliS [Planctomycetota bacterium]MCH9777373.1 flagellar export chaperone FliS [Planctomycetota bacterium]MCH9792406.1 flagellar export chaperone FliS [Planctomycetota bacterium]MDF1746199.1 flagellar export chaperone FliS [Gimesia sp.]